MGNGVLVGLYYFASQLLSLSARGSADTEHRPPGRNKKNQCTERRRRRRSMKRSRSIMVTAYEKVCARQLCRRVCSPGSLARMHSNLRRGRGTGDTSHPVTSESKGQRVNVALPLRNSVAYRAVFVFRDLVLDLIRLCFGCWMTAMPAIRYGLRFFFFQLQ